MQQFFNPIKDQEKTESTFDFETFTKLSKTSRKGEKILRKGEQEIISLQTNDLDLIKEIIDEEKYSLLIELLYSSDYYLLNELKREVQCWLQKITC